MSRIGSAPVRPGTRGPAAVLGVVSLIAALLAVSTGSAAAQEPPVPACAGVSIDLDVRAASLAGGAWSVSDVCVPPEAVYEAQLLGYQLVGGLGIAGAPGGSPGRVAFITAKVAEDRSLTLVGVEDGTTGSVTWAYADGTFAQDGATRAVGGAADAATIPAGGVPGPVEDAQIGLAIDGTGTDLASAQGAVPDQIRAFLDQAASALTAG